MRTTPPDPSAPYAPYRLALEQRLRELAAELDHDADKLHGDIQDLLDVIDQKDQAEIAMRTRLDDAETSRDLAELREVRAALERLDAGRYGLCIECGEPIPFARLDVQPAAARCAACQTNAERSPARAAGRG